MEQSFCHILQCYYIRESNSKQSILLIGVIAEEHGAHVCCRYPTTPWGLVATLASRGAEKMVGKHHHGQVVTKEPT
jgi:hypothetical protein